MALKEQRIKMSLIKVNNKDYLLRAARPDDVPQLRMLVNNAYKELSDMGLNYTATYQDEAKTFERISKGTAFVLIEQNEIIATILLGTENHFTSKNTAYISQFAVQPHLKKNGLGSLLMDYCEQLAHERGFEGIQLDTAIPAEHLVKWYLKRGYKIVGKTHWDGKTYDSYIFEKSFD